MRYWSQSSLYSSSPEVSSMNSRSDASMSSIPLPSLGTKGEESSSHVYSKHSDHTQTLVQNCVNSSVCAWSALGGTLQSLLPIKYATIEYPSLVSFTNDDQKRPFQLCINLMLLHGFVHPECLINSCESCHNTEQWPAIKHSTWHHLTLQHIKLNTGLTITNNSQYTQHNELKWASKSLETWVSEALRHRLSPQMRKLWTTQLKSLYRWNFHRKLAEFYNIW